VSAQASHRIAIAGLGSISAIGHARSRVDERYRATSNHALSRAVFPCGEAWVGALPTESEALVQDLRASSSAYATLDRSVLLAVLAARAATVEAGWSKGDPGAAEGVGVCLGSSRGATHLLEQYHGEYMADPSRRLPVLASPSTTLGNLSSWVAQDLGLAGIACEQSVTCSSSLHAIGTAIAWLRAGMARRFLAGGTEAPLTGFTLAQMNALRLTQRSDGDWPCRPCGQPPRNTLTLGEGAAVLALELAAEDDGRPHVAGCGFAREMLESSTGISSEGRALRESMTKAIREFTESGGRQVDAIVLHAPGTTIGDEAELRAIADVFGTEAPPLVSNKWVIGHTLGASGSLSIDLACSLLRTQSITHFPYPSRAGFRGRSRPIRAVMINATGFGGNAASFIIAV
jgi:3-oxoacyl-(acyl-carrier-protein) synthase